MHDDVSSIASFIVKACAKWVSEWAVTFLSVWTCVQGIH